VPKSAIAASIILAMTGVGLAQAQNSASYGQGDNQNNNNQGDNGKSGHQDRIAAPEIDPASAITALTLLAGGLAVIRGRRLK
jgi:hypothetical protein